MIGCDAHHDGHVCDGGAACLAALVALCGRVEARRVELERRRRVVGALVWPDAPGWVRPM